MLRRTSRYAGNNIGHEPSVLLCQLLVLPNCCSAVCL
ncbi:hypothetical protein HZS_7831 [Henneguya salminicola]|nr:hypothetical protein HZS_7831 [Henneguya salminicola]